MRLSRFNAREGLVTFPTEDEKIARVAYTIRFNAREGLVTFPTPPRQEHLGGW